VRQAAFCVPIRSNNSEEEVFEMNIPTVDLALTGANIVNLRKAAGLSVHDLQMVFGFNSPQAIYKWQNGAALPTVDNLIVLAALFDVLIDDILVTTHS
jgi:DNA-binding transcriptional regulator YiaG